ncbi:DUF86 domain-containing protein [Nanoarchaeota archaeon]
MRIDDKITEIDGYLGELLSIVPDDFREYISDKKTKAACERYFEKIVEAVVDLAFLVVKETGLMIPEDDKEVFDSLAEDKLISRELALRLKEAKGMRNILAHQYGNVDDEIVFQSITKELVRDVKELVLSLKKR